MKVRSSSTKRGLCMQKANKCQSFVKDFSMGQFRGSTVQQQEESDLPSEEVPKRLKTSETMVLIPPYDNTELRRDLIDRCEIIVLDIIEQLCAGEMPRLSYRIPTVDTLTEQVESQRTELSSNESNTESPEIFEVLPSTVLESPESMEIDSFKPDERESQDLPVEPRNVVDFARKHSRKKLALMMTVIGKVHNLLLNDKTETRRSLYYELKSDANTVELVSNQSQVDAAVRDVAYLLECSPWDTRLVATAKGLAAGKLMLTLDDDDKIDYDVPGGALIPQNVANVDTIKFRAEMVIVVEKDTVFQKLLQEKCPSALNCILITGKGYPDVPTRMLVKHLAEAGGLPVYVLVDADPYGMEIMLTYKYGSVTLCRDQGSLACPSAQWIGIYPSELSSNGITRLSLTDGDRVKLDALQCRSYIGDEFARELEIMKEGKAEIENISGLTSMYLPLKISNYKVSHHL